MPLRPVAGAVLSGGASTRMGRDKSLVEVAGVAMARRVADALTAAGCSPVIAVGGDASALAALGLHVVADDWPGQGPLAGVLTALASTRSATVVAACDLPWLDAGTVEALIAAAAGPADADVIAAQTDRLEPLCALWMPSSQRVLREMFDGGERAVIRVMDHLRVITVRASPAALRNVNRPADLPATPPG